MLSDLSDIKNYIVDYVEPNKNYDGSTNSWMYWYDPQTQERVVAISEMTRGSCIAKNCIPVTRNWFYKFIEGVVYGDFNGEEMIPFGIVYEMDWRIREKISKDRNSYIRKEILIGTFDEKETLLRVVG